MGRHSVTIRDLRFSLTDAIPRYWLGGNRPISLFMDHLSIVFPPGERFFMKSVRHFEHLLDDPELEEAVRAFHAQEGLHGREHSEYNRLLHERGYPVEAIDASAKALLGLCEKLLPKSFQLAVTVSLEHFTALLAQFLLATDSVLRDAPPEMAAMWRWHAAEENEHSAVPFEVYRAAGGNYPVRVTVMFFATLLFWGKMLEHQARMMKADGCLFSAKEWAGLLHFAFVEPGVIRLLWPSYLAFYRPGFHPHQIASGDLLSEWRREYDTSPVYAQSGGARRA